MHGFRLTVCDLEGTSQVWRYAAKVERIPTIPGAPDNDSPGYEILMRLSRNKGIAYQPVVPQVEVATIVTDMASGTITQQPGISPVVCRWLHGLYMQTGPPGRSPRWRTGFATTTDNCGRCLAAAVMQK